MPTYVIAQVTTQRVYTEFAVIAENETDALATFGDGDIQSVLKEEVLDTYMKDSPTVERHFD